MLVNITILAQLNKFILAAPRPDTAEEWTMARRWLGSSQGIPRQPPRGDGQEVPR